MLPWCVVTPIRRARRARVVGAKAVLARARLRLVNVDLSCLSLGTACDCAVVAGQFIVNSRCMFQFMHCYFGGLVFRPGISWPTTEDGGQSGGHGAEVLGRGSS